VVPRHLKRGPRPAGISGILASRVRQAVTENHRRACTMLSTTPSSLSGVPVSASPRRRASRRKRSRSLSTCGRSGALSCPCREACQHPHRHDVSRDRQCRSRAPTAGHMVQIALFRQPKLKGLQYTWDA